MSETTVSTTVAFLFGGMVFLLVYTRLGGMATTLLAGAILVVYLLIEAWHAWHVTAPRLARRVRRHVAARADARMGPSTPSLAVQLVDDPEHDHEHDQHENDVLQRRWSAARR